MKYGSVCSGIEAATVAWHTLGFEPQWFSEIEKFPSAVLAHHYPKVKNLGDMNNIYKKEEFLGKPIDVLVGGTPCQSFSVAGLRKGLADPRGNLALVFLAILDKARPKWVVWENVPGVLSSEQGRDFGAFLGGLAELGYGFAYRVLDAQFFGIPQRRRRVFVIGYFGDWRPAAAVLFERQSLSWDPPPSRETKQGTTKCFTTSPDGSGREDQATPTLDARAKDGPRRNQGGTIISIPTSDICPPLQARDYKDINTDDTSSGGKHVIMESILYENHGCDSRMTECKDGLAPTIGARCGTGGNNLPLVGQPIIIEQNTQASTPKKPSLRGHKTPNYAVAIQGSMIGRNEKSGPQGSGIDDRGKSFTLTKTDIHAVAFEPGSIARNAGPKGEQDTVSTLRADMGDNQPAIRSGMQVRRLTPRECERLQGFPDDYTLIPWRGGGSTDGPRYKALGNSMAVPVMNWLGLRISMVDECIKKQKRRTS